MTDKDYRVLYEEARAEAAACIDFIRTLAGWHTFWDEGFLGKAQQSESMSTQNGARLHAFLKESGHAARLIDELDSLREKKKS